MPEGVAGWAEFSPCGRYRYLLGRVGGSSVWRVCIWIMLNPSTADALLDDRTIRRCWDFARAWGFQNMVVWNLFGLRATDPREIYAAEDPIGPENDTKLLKLLRDATESRVIAAWGKHGNLNGRADQVLQLLAGHELHCLGTNADGSPKHPLYLPKTTRPIPYIRAA